MFFPCYSTLIFSTETNEALSQYACVSLHSKGVSQPVCGRLYLGRYQSSIFHEIGFFSEAFSVWWITQNHKEGSCSTTRVVFHQEALNWIMCYDKAHSSNLSCVISKIMEKLHLVPFDDVLALWCSYTPAVK